MPGSWDGSGAGRQSVLCFAALEGGAFELQLNLLRDNPLVMTLRIVSLAMLVAGGVVLLISDMLWLKALGAAGFMMGFVIFAMDLMRRNITKDD